MKQILLPDNLPQKLILEITPKCNYKCPYCYCLWHEFSELGRNVLSTQEWYSVIENAVQNNCREFLFSGGEVLLHQDLKKLIEYAGTFENVRLEIFTNASRMTEEYLQYFKDKKVHISTSLQGLRTYAEMTGTKRKFYKTIEIISRCREINFPCSVSVTVTKQNMFEIEDIVSAASFAGADIVQVNVVMNAGRAMNNGALLISEEEWKSVKENLNKLNFSCPVVFGEEFDCKCMSDKQFKCPAGSEWGVISPNGTYRKCLHYYEKNIQKFL